MIQKSIRNSIIEVYSKPPKKNYATNKTDVSHIDDIWSLDLLALKDYGPENNRGYRHVLVIKENFSKFGWTIPLKNKNAQTITDPFENFMISSKKPNFVETDCGKEFYSQIFQKFFKKNFVKLFSRKTSVGVVCAERSNKTTRNLFKRPVFKKGDSNWIDVLPAVAKQF